MTKYAQNVVNAGRINDLMITDVLQKYEHLQHADYLWCHILNYRCRCTCMSKRYVTPHSRTSTFYLGYILIAYSMDVAFIFSRIKLRTISLHVTVKEPTFYERMLIWTELRSTRKLLSLYRQQTFVILDTIFLILIRCII